MSTNPNSWIFDEILRGLQQLSCLGLDRQPASELLPGTARTWLQAVCTGKHWDQERDTPRFRRAFVVLTQNRRTWPVPADFLEAMPKVDATLPALPKSVCSTEQAHQHFDTIVEELATEPRWKSEARGAHGMSSMSEAARELARELDAREGRG